MKYVYIDRPWNKYLCIALRLGGTYRIGGHFGSRIPLPKQTSTLGMRVNPQGFKFFDGRGIIIIIRFLSTCLHTSRSFGGYIPHGTYKSFPAMFIPTQTSALRKQLYETAFNPDN